MSCMIAALYVATGGCYFNLEDVDPWDIKRDARGYAGPHPVVAHPPCQRWGRYWSGGPNPKAQRQKLGDDGGCFAAALASVRRWGGVLEHPEASHAWRAHGLITPMRSGGWSAADGDGNPSKIWGGGWTCCVEQGAYGHSARKATWLYAIGCKLPALDWKSPRDHVRLDRGFHSAAERAAASRSERSAPRLSKAENVATPPAFRDLLIAMARSAYSENHLSHRP